MCLSPENVHKILKKSFFKDAIKDLRMQLFCIIQWDLTAERNICIRDTQKGGNVKMEVE